MPIKAPSQTPICKKHHTPGNSMEGFTPKTGRQMVEEWGTMARNLKPDEWYIATVPKVTKLPKEALPQPVYGRNQDLDVDGIPLFIPLSVQQNTQPVQMEEVD
jgi:hypothetical protein